MFIMVKEVEQKDKKQREGELGNKHFGTFNTTS